MKRSCGFFLVFLLWGLGADILGVFPDAVIPHLGSTLTRIAEILLSGELYREASASLIRWAIGFAIGAPLGITTGVLIGSNKLLRELSEAPIEFIRAIPVTAMIPLFLLGFGVGDSSKIAMIFLPTFLFMLVGASCGVMQTSPLRKQVAAVFGASRLQLFCQISFFEALPQIFSALRLALSLSLVVCIVSEMFVGTDYGLGRRVYESFLMNSVETLFAYLIVLGSIGSLCSWILLRIERYLLHWVGK